jgi:hypothetical protein
MHERCRTSRYEAGESALVIGARRRSVSRYVTTSFSCVVVSQEVLP